MGLAIGHHGELLQTASAAVAAGEVDGQAVGALRLVVLRVQLIEVVVGNVRIVGSEEALADADLHEVVIAALQTLPDALQQADQVLVGGERLAEVLIRSAQSDHLATGLFKALSEQTVDLRE